MYEQLFNSQGVQVRGLWKKSGAFYAQLDANDGNQYRYQLQAETLPQAVLARQVLKSKQQAGNLFPPGNQPEKEGLRSGEKREAVIKLYQDDRDQLHKKADATSKREDSGLRFWIKKFGSVEITQINSNNDGQRAEAAAIGELVVDESQAPAFLGPGGWRKRHAGVGGKFCETSAVGKVVLRDKVVRCACG